MCDDDDNFILSMRRRGGTIGVVDGSVGGLLLRRRLCVDGLVMLVEALLALLLLVGFDGFVIDSAVPTT